MTVPGFPLSRGRLLGIARAAGFIIEKRFTSGFTMTFKEDQSPVTAADKEVNRFVISEVQRDAPGIDILGEEESARTESPWQLQIDPIDGTLPFTWGLPASTFMAALLFEGKPQMSVVCNPYADALYYAVRGEGAFVRTRTNTHCIRVSECVPGDGSKGKPAVGLATAPRVPGLDMFDVGKVLGKSGIRSVMIASMGYLDMLVARGVFVGTIFTGDTPWDTSAGHLIIEEAGGKATDLEGNPINYGFAKDRTKPGRVFSNGQYHEVLLDAVARSREW